MFVMSSKGWAQGGFQKKCAGTRYAELVFLHPVGSPGHAVHSGASGAQNIDTPFFTLGWARYGFHKKHTGTSYAELVILHPVGSVGHIVHSRASGYEMSTHYFSCSSGTRAVSIQSAQGHVMPKFCFYIRSDLRVTWCIRGVKRRHTIFCAQVGAVRFPYKVRRDTFTPILCVFASGKICGSRSSFWGVRAANIDTLFFILEWDRYGFDKKCTRTRNTELVFLHPVGSVGHVVHSAAFRARNDLHYISCWGGPGVVSIKSAPGLITPNFSFCIQWYLRVT
jgi:hypothetical protein